MADMVYLAASRPPATNIFFLFFFCATGRKVEKYYFLRHHSAPRCCVASSSSYHIRPPQPPIPRGARCVHRNTGSQTLLAQTKVLPVWRGGWRLLHCHCRRIYEMEWYQIFAGAAAAAPILHVCVILYGYENYYTSASYYARELYSTTCNAPPHWAPRTRSRCVLCVYGSAQGRRRPDDGTDERDKETCTTIIHTEKLFILELSSFFFCFCLFLWT